jgi:hypothetical protein
MDAIRSNRFQQLYQPLSLNCQQTQAESHTRHEAKYPRPNPAGRAPRSSGQRFAFFFCYGPTRQAVDNISASNRFASKIVFFFFWWEKKLILLLALSWRTAAIKKGNAHAMTWVSITSGATTVRRIPSDFQPLQPQLAHNSTRLPPPASGPTQPPTPATRIYATPPRLPLRVFFSHLIVPSHPISNSSHLSIHPCFFNAFSSD